MKKANVFAARFAVWIVALLLMVGLMWYVDQKDPERKNVDDPGVDSVEDDTPIGYEVGMRCPDFVVSLYGENGGEFRLAETRGRVTVINFWATWCTPCCNELPHFQQIFENYPDDVSLVAIHSNLVTDDVEAYLAEKAYTMPFALDKDGTVISSLGGSTMLPMTVVLDRNGIVVYNKVGSVTYDLLQSLIESLI